MPHSAEHTFRHEALFYEDDVSFLAGTMPPVRAALEADGAALVALPVANARVLREALEAGADRVRWVDMEAIGRNPARIIPVWTEFLAAHAATRGPVVGIGEPAWPGRGDDELEECAHHESLLNLAFEGGAPWLLLCPYDASRLDPRVLATARRTHPHVVERGAGERSGHYAAPAAEGLLTTPLPALGSEPSTLRFARGDDLAPLRALVAGEADEIGLPRQSGQDLVLAINELATNTLRHGGGGGELRIWQRPGALVAEVEDAGAIADPLAGRRPIAHGAEGGRGLWLVNQVCDLVQLRATATGTVVRVHMRSPAA